MLTTKPNAGLSRIEWDEYLEIPDDEIASWKPGENIFIASGTGTGKSFTSQIKLVKLAHKRHVKELILLPRRRTLDQFNAELTAYVNSGTIPTRCCVELCLYQSLENMGDKERKDFLSKFAYIVVDECQYFLADSTFNKFTDFSIDAILATNATKIFMTATPNKIYKFFNNYCKLSMREYWHGQKSLIHQLLFYQDDATLTDLIEEIIHQPYKKALIFCSDTRRAVRLYKEYKTISVFDCSAGNPFFDDDKDKNKQALKCRNDEDNLKELDYLITRSQLSQDKKLLIATPTLDTGFNVVDRCVDTIILDNMSDYEEMTQFIGRKRMQSQYDDVNVLIRIPKKQSLGGRYKKAMERCEKAHDFIEHGEESYWKDHEKDNDKTDVVFTGKDGRLHVNTPAYFKAKEDKPDYEAMMSKDPWAFPMFIAEKLGVDFKPDMILPTLEDLKLEKKLKALCESEKVWITKSQKSALFTDLNQRANGRVIRSAHGINKFWDARYFFTYRLSEYQMVVDDEESGGKKVTTVIQVINAEKEILDAKEKYLESCYQDKTVWYTKDERNIVDDLGFTGNRGRLLSTYSSINSKLESLNSHFRIKEYKTSRIVKDEHGKSYKQSCNHAWTLIRI